MLNSNKIIFDTITIQNFLSIGAPLTFDFKSHQGMNYVFGLNRDVREMKNGSGKSSLFVDSVLFALFGQTSKKVNKPNIINRLAKKDCLVELTFEINSKKFRIKQGVTPTFLQLFENDVDITKSSIKETQHYIQEEILRTTYDVFKNSVILSVNDTVSIFQMAKHEKRTFIENLFNLSIFGLMYSNVKNDLNILDKELLIEQASYRKTKEDIDEFNNKLKTFDKDKTIAIEELINKIATCQTKKQSLAIVESTASLELTELFSKLQEAENKIKELHDAEHKLKGALVSSKRELDHNSNILGKYEVLFDSVCEKCRPALDTFLKVGEAKNETPIIKDKITRLDSQMAKILEFKQQLYISREEFSKQITVAQEKVNQIKANQNELKYLDEKIQDLTSQLNKKKEEESPFQQLIDKYSKTLALSTAKINDLLDQRKYLDYMIFALSENGVKKYIVADLINILNNRIKKYLEDMGSEYTLIFDPNFDVTFLTTSGECEFNNFSAGERQRISMATILAFRDILRGQGTLESSILVCDEILDISMDDIAINALIKILKQEALQQTVFVISHREAVDSGDFENIIEIVKDNGYTQIVSDPQGGLNT